MFIFYLRGSSASVAFLLRRDYAFVRRNVRVTIKLRIHLRKNRSISERRKAGYVSGEEMTINQKRYRDTAPSNQHRIRCNDFRVLLSSAL